MLISENIVFIRLRFAECLEFCGKCWHDSHALCLWIYHFVKPLNNDDSTSELQMCVKVEVAIPGSSSLSLRRVSVDVKQH